MFMLGPLGFSFPLALFALAGLPALWWLLRVTPPPARVIAFPAIRLLRDLVRPEETPARTPLWILLLRLLLAALPILACAGPVWKPVVAFTASAPLVIVVDNGWAAASDWTQVRMALDQALSDADAAGRRVVLLATADTQAGALPNAQGPDRASTLKASAEALQPMPWDTDRAVAASALAKLDLPAETETLWIADGLESPKPEDSAVLATTLAKWGKARIIAPQPGNEALLLTPPHLEGGKMTVFALRASRDGVRQALVRVSGPDGHVLGSTPLVFEAGKGRGFATFDLPVELLNNAERLDIAGAPAAGGTFLLDARWRRKPVGLLAAAGEGDALLNGNTYLGAALAPYTDLRAGSLDDLLAKPLTTLVLDDPAALPQPDQERIRAWIEKGGVLVRFAGPHLAAETDGLVPVALQHGDRALGGALSWSAPAHLAPFAADSPFNAVPQAADITIGRQVLATPGPDLAGKTWAALADGTPLVTAAKTGEGWLILIHTTATPAWSNLALSGTFVEMLRRLIELGAGVGAEGAAPAGKLAPATIMDGFGSLGEPGATAVPINGAAFDQAVSGPAHPPGLYGDRNSRHALNVAQSRADAVALPAFPNIEPVTFQAANTHALSGGLFLAALLLLGIDLLAGLWLKGLIGKGARAAAIVTLLLCVAARPALADPSDNVPTGAISTTLGYIKTGITGIDQTSELGLSGLTRVLLQRTSVEDAGVIGVNPETDDLALFPLLYWPVSESETTPSPQAIARLNTYLDSGGMILFDLRESGQESVAAMATLKRLTTGLAIPALQAIPDTHTLTKSFYLLRAFPGRYDNDTLWVEKSPNNQNDGVSSVIVGSNDWAASWAVDENGATLADIEPRQREMALRFGVNLVMYALTGNYKSDQVHTPAILERLGK